MRKVRVENRQSVWDLANQLMGHADGVYQLMHDNPGVLNFEGFVSAGTIINVDESKVINKSVVEYFTKKGIKPATAQDGDGLAFSSGFSFGFR